jgi:hypothetical protein
MILSAIGSAYGEDATDEIQVALSVKAETVLKDMDHKVMGIQSQMNKVYSETIKLLEKEKVEVTKKGNLEMALGVAKKIEELKKLIVEPNVMVVKAPGQEPILGKWIDVSGNGNTWDFKANGTSVMLCDKTIFNFTWVKKNGVYTWEDTGADHTWTRIYKVNADASIMYETMQKNGATSTFKRVK